MMRHYTPEEIELLEKLKSNECSEEEKKVIIEKLQEIDKKERGPFD